MRGSTPWTIALLLLGAVAAQAMIAPPVLQDARTAYEEGNYAAAVEHYEAALAQGADHPLVHYNLGNAHFRAGDLGEAIVSYVRAQRLAPRDERIASNLRVARAQIRDRELGGEVPAVLAPAAWLYGLLSLDEWWTLFAVAFAAVAIAAIVGHWRPALRPVGRRAMIAAGTVAVLALLMGGIRYRNEVATARAIVVAQEVQVRSGPGDDYGLAFRVHEGLQVTVDERRERWWRIDLGGELVGWVPAASLERI